MIYNVGIAIQNSPLIIEGERYEIFDEIGRHTCQGRQALF